MGCNAGLLGEGGPGLGGSDAGSGLLIGAGAGVTREGELVGIPMFSPYTGFFCRSKCGSGTVPGLRGGGWDGGGLVGCVGGGRCVGGMCCVCWAYCVGGARCVGGFGAGLRCCWFGGIDVPLGAVGA